MDVPICLQDQKHTKAHIITLYLNVIDRVIGIKRQSYPEGSARYRDIIPEMGNIRRGDLRGISIVASTLTRTIYSVVYRSEGEFDAPATREVRQAYGRR